MDGIEAAIGDRAVDDRRGQRARPVRPVPRPSARQLRALRHAELPRDEELHLRRGWRADRQRRARRRPRPRALRQGHQPPRVHARRGRQVLVAGHRLVVRLERRARRVPLRPARAARRRSSPSGARCSTATRRMLAPIAEPSSACSSRSCPPTANQAYHMFYVLLPDRATRNAVLESMREQGVQPTFHYVPLHSAPAADKFARAAHGVPRHRRHQRPAAAAPVPQQPLDRATPSTSSRCSTRPSSSHGRKRRASGLRLGRATERRGRGRRARRGGRGAGTGRAEAQGAARPAGLQVLGRDPGVQQRADGRHDDRPHGRLLRGAGARVRDRPRERRQHRRLVGRPVRRGGTAPARARRQPAPQLRPAQRQPLRPAPRHGRLRHHDGRRPPEPAGGDHPPHRRGDDRPRRGVREVPPASRPSSHRKLGSKAIGLINRRIFGQPHDLTVSNFRILRRDVVDRICASRSAFPYITGQALLYSNRPTNVDVEHAPRAVGKSTYSPVRIARLVLRILFSYSLFPLRLSAVIGFLISTLSFATGPRSSFTTSSRTRRSQGWTSVIVLLSFFNGVDHPDAEHARRVHAANAAAGHRDRAVPRARRNRWRILIISSSSVRNGAAPRTSTRLLDEHPEIEMAKPVAARAQVLPRRRAVRAGRRVYESAVLPRATARVRGEKSTSYIESETAADRIVAMLPDAP